MAFDNVSIGIFGLVILMALTSSTVSKRFYPSSFEELTSKLPWVGEKKGFFSNFQLAGLGDPRKLVESGYRQFSKLGRPFVLPGFHSNMILIPGSQVKWMADQADSVLNAKDMQKDTLQTARTLLDPSIVDNPVHEIIIRRDLTRQLGSLIPEIEEELDLGIKKYWGADEENWTEVGVFDTMMKVVSRTSNRVFVGPSLCRNEDYLKNAGAFSQDIAISSILLKMLPGILKPFLAWIVLLPNRWHHHRASKYLVPFIRERILELNAADEGKSVPEHNDFTNWFIKEVATSADATERTPEKIALRLMTLNFAAIHTSTFTATNVLFDLYGSPTAEYDIKVLRQEIEEVYAENGGTWNKNAVAKLVKVDSALRESLRISTFMIHGMDRLVIDPKGVTMEDGLHLPQGSRVGTATWSIHHDNSIYNNANTYEAFRFSEARDVFSNSNSTTHDKESLSKVLQSKNLTTVTTSDTFLPFGHGKHACPGRFFAATEMKLLMAYVIMNYDVKFLEQRPPNKIMGGSILPPMKEKLMIRRRKL